MIKCHNTRKRAATWHSVLIGIMASLAGCQQPREFEYGLYRLNSEISKVHSTDAPGLSSRVTDEFNTDITFLRNGQCVLHNFEEDGTYIVQGKDLTITIKPKHTLTRLDLYNYIEKEVITLNMKIVSRTRLLWNHKGKAFSSDVFLDLVSSN